MPNLVADIHTHSIASGHAYGTIREMAQAAAEKKLQLLGISEHAPGIPGTCDPIYYCNLKVIPRELYGVKIIFGSEINVLDGGKLSLAQKDLDRLDYGIVGIHSPCYDNQDREKNTENLISCMENEKIFFVSHPDDDRMPLDYEKLVRAAKDNHVALEVNNSSLLKPHIRLNCFANYRTMLKLCAEYKTPIVINSDAHDPSGVGNFAAAKKLIAETGFDENLILNTDAQKMLDFIGFNK